MTEKEIELVDALMDMVNQHCQVEYDEKKGSVCDDGALSSNESALWLLEELGFAKNIRGRFFRLDFKKLEEARHVHTTSASTPLPTLCEIKDCEVNNGMGSCMKGLLLESCGRYDSDYLDGKI